MTAPLLTCPHCGESFAAESVAQGRDLAEYIAILDGFGSYACTVREYIGLFKAGPESKQRLSTKLKLARELERLWRTGEFSSNRVTYRLSHSDIANALHVTVQAMGHKCGLKNHNYLKKVMLPEARRQAAKQETERERARQTGIDRDKINRTMLKETARQASRNPAPKEEDARPIWEQSLETQAVTYASITSSNMMASAMRETVERLAANLSAAGIDLERLTELGRQAENAADLTGRGAELLRRCKKDGSGPQAVGECLPVLEKGIGNG